MYFKIIGSTILNIPAIASTYFMIITRYAKRNSIYFFICYSIVYIYQYLYRTSNILISRNISTYRNLSI